MCELGFYSYNRSFTRYKHVHMRLIMAVHFHYAASIFAPNIWYMVHEIRDHGRL